MPEAAVLKARTLTIRPRLSLALLFLLHSATATAALELHDAERIVLDNGLTVLLLEDRNFPVVSVQMLYKVGARDEVTGKTGLAHFLEHMAFRATKKYPDTEVVSRIYGQGGEWHGYTWLDQTTYFATAPRDDLELLLSIEAERMSSLVIDPDDIEPERGAVLAEMHMYENDPTSMLIDALMYTSFLAHPYRNNTIGWEEDIESVSHADAVDFYRRHYHPANGVLAVVGDFDRRQALAMIGQLFGSLPQRTATPLPHTVEPLQRGERRVGVSGAAPGKRFAIGYRAPSANHPDFVAFLVLQEILAGGSGVSFLQNDWGTAAKPGSALHGVSDDVSTWFPPGAQDYIFMIGGSFEGTGEGTLDEQELEARIEARIAALREQAPGDEQVAAAIEAVLDALVFDVQTTEDAAHQLAYFEGLGALELLLTLPQRVQRITGDDVARVARQYLLPERRTISWYRPASMTAPAAQDGTIPATFTKPAAGNPDDVPVAPAVLRRLGNGVPAIVQASDMAPTVQLKLIVSGAPLHGGGFDAHDPEPGVSSWNGAGRADTLPELAAEAAAALAAARPAKPAPPQALDPETRLHEEFVALMGLPQADTVVPAALVVAGDVDVEATFELLEQRFGGFDTAASTPSPAPVSPSGRQQVELGLPVAQAQLGYIVAAPSPADDDYLAWRLLQYIVAHGYEGRLGKEAISRRGLAYYIDAGYASGGGPGWSTLSIGVDLHKLGDLEGVMAGEFARLRSEPPTQAEVDEAKRHLVGRAISAAQSNGELTGALARHWLRHGTTPTVSTLRKQLETVTLADVRALVPAFTSGRTVAITP